MNILYIAHRIPYPPNKGDKIRSFNTIKYLADQNDVWCVCFVDDSVDFQHVAALREYCRDVVALPLRRSTALFRGMINMALGRTMTEGFHRTPAMSRAIKDLCDCVRFDAVLAFSSGMGQYAARVDVPRKVIDFCDLDSRKWKDYALRALPPKSWLFALEAKRLYALERQWISRFDATVLIDRREADGLYGPLRRKLHFIGNGVSLPAPEPPAPAASVVLNAPTAVVSDNLPAVGPPVVGFIGDMRYYPNEEGVCWFVRSVWPIVLQAVPDAVFEIVGRGPTRKVCQLNRRPGVEVVGEVAHTGDHLRRFHVSVAPLRIARGVQNKVLEAMAWTRPVVATSAAAAGIEADEGIDFCIADDPERFAHTVVHLLTHPLARAKMGLAARRCVSRRHNWNTAIIRLASLLKPTAAGAELPPVAEVVPPFV